MEKEIRIPKEEYKKQFGIESRPMRDDIYVYENDTYKIKYTQTYKDIMTSEIYYKVILEK